MYDLNKNWISRIIHVTHSASSRATRIRKMKRSPVFPYASARLEGRGDDVTGLRPNGVTGALLFLRRTQNRARKIAAASRALLIPGRTRAREGVNDINFSLHLPLLHPTPPLSSLLSPRSRFIPRYLFFSRRARRPPDAVGFSFA